MHVLTSLCFNMFSLNPSLNQYVLAYNTDAYMRMHECHVRKAKKHRIMQKKCQILTTQYMNFQTSDKNSSEQYPSIQVHIRKCMIQSDIWGAYQFLLQNRTDKVIVYHLEVTDLQWSIITGKFKHLSSKKPQFRRYRLRQ